MQGNDENIERVWHLKGAPFLLGAPKNYTGKIFETFPLTSPLSAPTQLSKTGSTLQLEIIRSAAQWAALADEWNALLKESHTNVPFLTYEFQRAWWEHLGGGEWSQAELNIVIGRGIDRQLLGIAPLFTTTQDRGERVFRFIGSHEIADYLDLIVRPADHAAFIQTLVRQLITDGARAEFYNLVDRSRTAIFLKETSKNGVSFHLETLQPSPYIKVPTTFEGYMEGLNSKQAHELRRKLRRAARNPSPITLEIVGDISSLDQAMEDFFRLMCAEAHKATFLTPNMRAQMVAIARAAFAGNWLQLIFLKCGAVRIAGYMNFDYDNCIWAYNAGFDNTYSDLSPGWVIMAEMMKWCIQHGRAVFDFMRGGEEYKYRFGAKDRFVLKAVIK